VIVRFVDISFLSSLFNLSLHSDIGDPVCARFILTDVIM